MKRKLQKLLFLMILAFTSMIINGCSSSKSSSYDEKTSISSTSDQMESAEMPAAGMPESAIAEEEGIGVSSGQGSTIGKVVTNGRKLIKNVYLDVETRTFDNFLIDISSQLENMGGYVENSEISGNSYDSDNNRYASLIVRVPSDQLNSFIKQVEEIGNVTYTQESVEDVTLQYTDIESHKKSLNIEQERLFVLLENAEELEDIIAIETRLSQVRYELEYYETQLRTYDNLIDYSKVTIEVREVERISSVENKTMWDKIQSGFIENIYKIADGLNVFVIWFLVSIPYIISWGILIVIGFLIVRIIIRKSETREKAKREKGNPRKDKNKKKKEEEQEEKE